MLFSLFLVFCPLDANGLCQLNVIPNFVSEEECRTAAQDFRTIANAQGFQGFSIFACIEKEPTDNDENV